MEVGTQSFSRDLCPVSENSGFVTYSVKEKGKEIRLLGSLLQEILDSQRPGKPPVHHDAGQEGSSRGALLPFPERLRLVERPTQLLSVSRKAFLRCV